MTAKPRNSIIWTAAVASLLAVGAGSGYWWAHRAMAGDETARVSGPNSGNSAAPGDPKILYWHDPMVPAQKFDKPGKSPFMDMQLVPVYAGEAGEGGDVRVNPNVAQNLGIRLGTVTNVMLSSRLRAVGSVAFDERALELVQSRVEGFVTHLNVRAALERVRRGQSLAMILAPQWLEAEQEYLALLDAGSKRAQALREAARQRLVVLGVPEETIQAVETTRKTTATTSVVAPIDGVVTELGVREGATFMAGTSLFRINGLAKVWVNAQIPEAKVSMIPMGSGVEAQATGWPGVTFKGRVIALLPQVDPQTRTFTARIALENPGYRLFPGMFVTLEFTGPTGEPSLVVPSEAIITTGERNVVIAAREGGGFDVVNVTLGAEQDGQTAILAGLTEGQSIVLSGQFLIDSEASLKSTANRLGTASAPVAIDGVGQPDGTVGASPTTQHLAQGTITAITPDSITIAHGPVPSLHWSAMTMGFTPPAQGVPKKLKVGDRVSFSFMAQDAGRFQIDRISALDQSAESVAPDSTP